jgi:hypothetical protein
MSDEMGHENEYEEQEDERRAGFEVEFRFWWREIVGNAFSKRNFGGRRKEGYRKVTR